MTQGIQEQSRGFSAVEAECHLVQVGREMFDADFVPRSHDAALEQGEGGFHGVCMDVTVNVDTRLVFDCFVFRGQSGFLHGTWIRSKFIGHHNFNILTDVFCDVLCQRPRPRIGGMEKSQIAAAT